MKNKFIVITTLVMFSTQLLAVENYANALFRPLHTATCLDAQQDMRRQFEELQGVNYPPNFGKFTIRHMGDVGTEDLIQEIANPVTWDPSIYTGLYINENDRPLKQRGHKNDPILGTNVFQLDCTRAGFLINTYQFDHSLGTIECPPSLPNCLGGSGIDLSREFGAYGPRPFRSVSSELTLQVNAKLPHVHYGPNDAAAGQIYMYAYLRDLTTDTQFAWLVQIFDSRAFGDQNGNSFIGNDGVVTFTSTPLRDTLANGSPNNFATRSPYSADYSNQYNWGPGERFYRAHLKRNQLLGIIDQLNQLRAPLGQPLLSTNLADWALNSIGIAAEVGYRGVTSNQISIGGSWDNFEAYEAYEANDCPAGNCK